MELVGIQKHLIEGCVPKGQRFSFLNPRCCRLGGCDVDLMLAGSGDGGPQLAQDVLFLQPLDQTAVILVRNQIPAGRIKPDPKLIGRILEPGAEAVQHRALIFIGGSNGLRCCVVAGIHKNGLLDRLAHLGIIILELLQAIDLSTEIYNLCLQLLILGNFLGRKQSVLPTVRIQISLCVVPCLCALNTQFIDGHAHKITSKK